MATLGEDIFDRTGMAILGTLRKNGWPLISPLELIIVDGHLYLGMMWQSQKALDLLRDPRCTLHSATSERDGSEGDFKIYGWAGEIYDLEMRRRYCEAVFEKLGWELEEPESHLFSVKITIEITMASHVDFKDEKLNNRVWRAT